MADFGRDLRSSESGRARRNFFFLSGKKRTTLPISRRPNLTKFKHNTSIRVALNSVGKEFGKFCGNRSFFQKNSKIEFFSTSCDFRLP